MPISLAVIATAVATTSLLQKPLFVEGRLLLLLLLLLLSTAAHTCLDAQAYLSLNKVRPFVCQSACLPACLKTVIFGTLHNGLTKRSTPTHRGSC